MSERWKVKRKKFGKKNFKVPFTHKSEGVPHASLLDNIALPVFLK